MSVLRRVTGMGTAGSLALALLAGACVLAATAGPRQAQATGTRALQQTMNGVPPLGRGIVVASNWATINAHLAAATGSGASQILTPANLSDATTQLRGDFSGGSLRLAPPSADWAAMTSDPYFMASTPPILKGIPAKLEVDYRYPAAGHLRLIAGTMPATSPPPTSPPPTSPPATRPPATANGLESVTDIQVVVTAQTARAFALRLGSAVVIGGPSDAATDTFSQVRLEVTGIVTPADPGSVFWKADPLLAAPALDYVGDSVMWIGAVIADPGESDVIQQSFGPAGLDIQWELPVSTTGVQGQAQALFSQVNQITNQTPKLTGYLAPMANALTVSSGLGQPLATLVQASQAVNVLDWMVYAGVAVAAIVLLLLAARMIAARRAADLTLRRARGASLWQIFAFGTLGAAVACGPAAAVAWAVAVLVLPGATPAGPAAWWPGLAALAIAVAGPGVAAAWPHRLSRPKNLRRRRRATRVIFEVTACAVAIGAITVLRAQAGAGDVYTSAAPVLVAVPAVIVVLRLYQLLLRGLARASARRRGVIGFLGLTRAAQATVTLALPAMTLVLALTVATFTGMLRTAVTHGETAASWQATGADVVVAASGPQSTASVISPSAVRAIAAVRGVQHAATAFVMPLNVANGGQVTGVAVDPAAYAALVASTNGFAGVDPALLTGTPGQGATPVLASARGAADLGGQQGSTIFATGLPTLRVRVSGELHSTPALPGGGAFIVLPLSAIGGVSGAPPVNLMLLTGPSIDMTRLHAVVQATMPGVNAPVITTRSQVLRELSGAQLQRGTFVLFTLAIVFAAVLALAVMLLELALSTADREMVLVRLATMGLTDGQRARLAALEVLPAIGASAVAAVVCAIALPSLVAPAIDLSVFTGSQAPVPLRPDFVSLALPLAGLVVVTVIALAYEIRYVANPRNVPAALRRSAG